MGVNFVGVLDAIWAGAYTPSIAPNPRTTTPLAATRTYTRPAFEIPRARQHGKKNHRAWIDQATGNRSPFYRIMEPSPIVETDKGADAT
jgi:hypothetical protein